MKPKLEPCPFCCGEATTIKTEDEYRPYIAQCLDCGAQTMPSVREEQVIKRWNARAEVKK